MEDLTKKPVGAGKVFLWVFLAAGVAGILGTCGNGGTGIRTTVDEGEAVGAWVVCQQFVEDRLKAPSTAEFPGVYSDHTTSLGGGRFRVDASVDAENSFGAMLRTDFSCVVNYQGNDNWRLESLDM
jgi:hypothetical protein